MVIILTQWQRRRNGKPANEDAAGVALHLRALADDVRQVSLMLNDVNRYLTLYERANETANRERHDEVVAAVDALHRDVKDIRRKLHAA